MTVELGRQGLEFLWAAALGLALGIIYDLCRAVRREAGRPVVTLAADLLFALAFFLSLLLTAIYTRGLRLYQCLGIALGAAVYFLTVSPALVRLWRHGLRLLRRLAGRVRAASKKIVEFFRKITKKLFSTREKWSRIKDISKPGRLRREARR